MEKGKLIVIEGTDCSGKETQSKLLIDRLADEGIKAEYCSFPNYDSPTGKIIGLAYLGKSRLAEQMVDNEIKNILKKLRMRDRTLKEVLSIMKAVCLKLDNFMIIDRILVKLVLRSIMIELRKNELDLRDQLLISLVIDEVKRSLSHGWFPEGAPNVDPKVSSLLYAADRVYNMPVINSILDEGTNVILDRYTYSNMAHQGGKISDKIEKKLCLNGLLLWSLIF